MCLTLCLSAMQETRVRSLGWEDPLEKEMAAHPSVLAWKIQWTAEPGRVLSVHEVAKSWTPLTRLSSSSSIIFFLTQKSKKCYPQFACGFLEFFSIKSYWKAKYFWSWGVCRILQVLNTWNYCNICYLSLTILSNYILFLSNLFVCLHFSMVFTNLSLELKSNLYCSNFCKIFCNTKIYTHSGFKVIRGYVKIWKDLGSPIFISWGQMKKCSAFLLQISYCK